jgi:hypothetical protein
MLGMSRGPGHIQQAILDNLAEYQMAVRTVDVAHWLSDVHWEGDTEPSRSQLESARRALKRLERDGRLVSELEPTEMGPPWRQRWYRLAENSEKKGANR